MKKLFSFLFLTASLCATSVAQNIYYETDFERSMPKDITTWDKDENPTRSGLMNVDFTGGTWARSLTDKDDRAAISSAYSTYDYPIEDWMILPKINVADQEAVLAWDAYSKHYDLREDYKIMISEGDMVASQFQEVYSVTEEDYFARRHAISLADYVGKDIYIAFVHTGQDKFILAIDNIKVGVIDNDFALINRTPMTAKGGEYVEVCGAIRNLSSEQTFEPVVIVDGVEYANEWTATTTTSYKPGDDALFSCFVPAPEEGAMGYEVAVKKGDNIVWSQSDTVYCSAFPRHMLMEEFTGTWCNNCPAGTVTMRKLEHQLRDGVIPVLAHCYPDTMYNAYYHTGVAYFILNLPGMVCDRKTGFRTQELSMKSDLPFVRQALSQPVTAEVVPTVRFTEDGKFEVNSTVRFSKEYDNSNDRYRIGYIFTENVVHVDAQPYTQANSCQTAQNREYYHLPSGVPARIMFYHDVPRGTDRAHTGEPNSLPNELLQPGVDYQVSHTLDMPVANERGYVIDPHNLSVTVVLMETRGRSLLNSYRVSTENIEYSAVEDAMQDNTYYNYAVVDGEVRVMGIEDQAVIRVYGVDGRTIATTEGVGYVAAQVGNYKGVAIVEVVTAAGKSFKKILIK